MTANKGKLGLLASTAMLACMATSGAAAAQSVEGPAAQGTQAEAAIEQTDTAAVEDAGQEIVVTGSSIRGAPPVGSSLIQLGRVEIENSTSTTTDQIVREIPQIFNFGVTDSSRTQNGGSANISLSNSINIRGIAPYATLTLINGRRPVPQGTIAASADPTNIPAIALERIEIVADGASAIYGSDAVTGVANLILRRSYDGLGTDVQYGFGEDYHTFTATAIVGRSWSTGRFTLSGQHAYRSALSGLDRDYYRSNLSDEGGTDFRATTCNPGNIQVGSTFYPIPQGGATSANLAAGVPNRCDVYKAVDLIPQQEINSGVLTFDQELGDNIKFFADGLYAARDGKRRGTTSFQNLIVPSSNAFFAAPAGVALPACAPSVVAPAGSRCETVQYDFASDYAPNQSLTDVSSRVWQLTGGFDIALGKAWSLNVYSTYGRNHDHATSIGNTTNAANLAAALASSNPATAFNPFGTTPNSPTVIAGIFDQVTDSDGRSRLWDSGAKLDGSLFALPGGDVKIAVGGEYFEQRVIGGQVRGPRGGQTGITQDLSRNVLSGYAELLIPVFGENNAIPGFKSLILDIAGRIDRYSDVGSTKNPKIGINWEPIDDVKLHGSYGTSFRAPLLNQIIAPSGVISTLILQTFFDPTANNGAGANIRGVAFAGSNLDLRPETARSWSFGLDYSPSWRPGAQLTLNYFDLVYKGQITSNAANANILLQEPFFQSIITRGPAAQALIAQRIAEGVTSTSSVAELQAANLYIEGRPSNLGTTITRGIDFGLVVPWTIESAGDFRFTLRGTRFLAYKLAFTPGGRVVDRLNTFENPLKLRARGSLSWSRGAADLTVFANYQNAYDNILATPVQKVKSLTTFDLAVGYKIGDVFAAKDVRIGLDITNLTDRDPPFANIAPVGNGGGAFDPNNASPIGRLVALSLRTRF